MIKPKDFYRKLDEMLSKIGSESSGKDFLIKIVSELETIFGQDLHIKNGRIYEEVDEEYLLISSTPGAKQAKVIDTVAKVSPAIQKILHYKTYIFDALQAEGEAIVGEHNEYSIPAAIRVYSPEYSWIFVFDLTSGWSREEIEFCLNAVRTALNQRLYSESIKNEMVQAQRIQASLLPEISPQIDGYQIAGRSRPAEIVGGDLYDYHYFSDNSIGVCIGDASGHGIPAALLVRDVITGLRMGMEEGRKITHVLKRLNQIIYRSIYSTRFISLFYAQIDSHGNMHYVNAGHPSPLLLNGAGLTALGPTGTIFGALEESNIYDKYAKIEPGSVLVLYTDAITERLNGASQEYGEERLKKMIVQNRHADAHQILETIFNTVYQYGKSSKWQDDATVIVIKRIR